jgi:hypothetical protein
VALRFKAALDAVGSATAWLIERRVRAMPDALSGATAYLKLLGDTVGGWMLAKGALAEPVGLRLALARVYGENVLATVPGQVAAVTGGSADLEAVTPEMLGGTLTCPAVRRLRRHLSALARGRRTSADAGADSSSPLGEDERREATVGGKCLPAARKRAAPRGAALLMSKARSPTAGPACSRPTRP